MLIIFLPPVAFVVSLSGVFDGQSRRYGIAGLVISAVPCCFLVYLLLAPLVR